MTKERRRMTTLERDACRALSGCTFPVASWSKRFARSMARQAAAEPPTITDSQSAALLRTCHKFRRQIKDESVRLASARFVRDHGQSWATQPVPNAVVPIDPQSEPITCDAVTPSLFSPAQGGALQ